MKNKIFILIVIGIVSLFIALALFNDNESNTSAPDTQSQLRLSDIHGLEVAIDNPDKLYLPNHQGLYSQESDGVLQKVGDISDDFMSFAVSPSDSTVFYASGHPKTGGNFGLIVSSDAGGSWENVSEGLNGPVDFHSMAVDSVNDQQIYGYYQGALQRSVDGGSTWEYLDNAPAQIVQLSSGATEGLVYAATTNGIYGSNDSGDSWSLIAFEGETIYAIEPIGDRKELLAFSAVGGLQLSSEDVTNWQSIDFSGRDPVLYIAASPSDTNRAYLVTKSLEIYKSKDGGLSWTVR
jgi:photosystem II stability/assembly factor-like uncharacterized protein